LYKLIAWQSPKSCPYHPILFFHHAELNTVRLHNKLQIQHGCDDPSWIFPVTMNVALWIGGLHLLRETNRKFFVQDFVHLIIKKDVL
jgi:hypothetical protein